jgi:hypothetical protein
VTVALLVTAQRESPPLHRDMYQLQQQILELVPDRFAPGAKQIIVGYVLECIKEFFMPGDQQVSDPCGR